MKKVFTYLAFLGAVAFMAFSCSPLPEDNSHTDVVVAAPAVNITISDVTDYTATVTIAPAGAANYYAYVVDKSDNAEELDPAKLYANKYTSVKNGLVKYAAQPSTEFSLEGLAPNTVYQVYAVAGSTTGVVGTIAVDSFRTSDKGTPMPVTPTKKDNVISVAFSEDVKYVSSLPATAVYYAYNNGVIGEDPETGKKIVVDSGAVGEANVAVSVLGKNVTFTVTLDGTNPLPDGAFFTIAYPAGAFEDMVGNPAPAMKHAVGVTSAGKLGFGNLYNRVPTKAFDLEYDEEKETALPSEKYFLYGIPEGTEFYEMFEEANATMTVISKGQSKVATTVYNLKNDYDWGYTERENAIYVYYPDDIEIKPGDTFKIDIDEGALQDIYGNTNNAFETGYLYSYGYNLEDIFGTYENAGVTIFTSKSDEDPWTFTIEKSDDATKGNVMITEYYGFDELDGVYANFDVNKGSLTFPVHYSVLHLGGMIYGSYYLDFSAWSYSSSKDEPTMTLYMTSLGEFTEGDDYPGYVYDIYQMPESGKVEDIDPEKDYLDYDYNMFMPEFSKVDAVESPAVAPASVKMPNYQIFTTDKIKSIDIPLKK